MPRMIAGGNAQEMSAAKRLPFMLMSKGFFTATEGERSEGLKEYSTLKALRRLSFLVPFGDILPESLLVFRKCIGIAVVCRVLFHHIT